MVQAKHLEAEIAEFATADGGAGMVRIDVLRKFPEIVLRLGGNPRTLLSKVHIDPDTLHNRQAVIPFRSVVHLLERAAAELSCADFGLRLAGAEDGLQVLGPLEFVMRNSRTVREAFRYCAEHCHVYSGASLMRFEPCPAPGTQLLSYELVLARLPEHPQWLEQAVLLTQRTALRISSGLVRAREIWFTHQPLSPLSRYQEYFGANVQFGQRTNGVMFAESELDRPLPNVDPQLYELATYFIEHRFQATQSVLSTRVRTLIERSLLAGNCTYNDVASTLGMHPRTLQRRLRAEGLSFESIKDSVRRDIALRYLTRSAIPLIRVAQLLGYTETSALCRSCYRWFAASPRQLRSGARVSPREHRAEARA